MIFLYSQLLILILVLLTLISSIYQSNLQFLFFLFTKTFNIKKKNFKNRLRKIRSLQKKAQRWNFLRDFCFKQNYKKFLVIEREKSDN